MKRGWLIGTAALWLLMVAWVGVCPAQSENRVVAVVGDELITSADVQRMVKTLEVALGPAASPEEAARRAAQLQDLALSTLIENKLFLIEAKRRGIKVSDAAIDRYIQRIKERNHISDREFAAQLSRRGITPEEYRESLREDLLKHKLIRREVRDKIVISDEQVAEYFKKHQSQYQNLDQVRIRALFLRIPEDASPEAKKAIRMEAERLRKIALEKNNLAELAKKYSQGPGADQGGVVGPVAVRDLLPAMRQALVELKPGQISPVVEVPGNFVFMQLLERSGKSGLPLGEVKEQIRAKLEREAFEKRLRKWVEQLKRKIYVQINR